MRRHRYRSARPLQSAHRETIALCRRADRLAGRGASSGQPIAKLALEHLARRIARQRADEDDVARDPGPRKMGSAMRLEVFFAAGRARFERKKRADPLAPL